MAIWERSLKVTVNEDFFIGLGYATPNPTGQLSLATPYSFSGATAYFQANYTSDPTSPSIVTLSSVPALSTTTTGIQTLPTGSIIVASTAGFSSSGTIYVTTSAGVVPVTYTNLASAPARFTGCVGGSGTTTVGGLVSQTLPNITFSYGTVQSVQSGFINISIPHTMTVNFPPGEWYYDLLIVQGTLQDYYAAGAFLVAPSVARV